MSSLLVFNRVYRLEWYFRPGADVVCADGSVAVAGGGCGAAGLLPPQHQQSKHRHSSAGKCSCNCPGKEMQYRLHYSYLPIYCPGIFLIRNLIQKNFHMECRKRKKTYIHITMRYMPYFSIFLYVG